MEQVNKRRRNFLSLSELGYGSEELNFRPRTKGGPSLLLTAEVKYSSRKIARTTARDGEKNMTHDSVSIFFKRLLKNLL